MAGKLPASFSLDAYLADLAANPQKVATRKASEMVLGPINDQLPETIYNLLERTRPAGRILGFCLGPGSGPKKLGEGVG